MMKLFRNILFASLLAPFGAYAATVDVWFNPQNTGTLTIGDTFFVDITVGNYSGPGTTVMGGSVNVSYDPSIIQAQGVSVPTGMGTMNSSVGSPPDNINGFIDTIGLNDFFGFVPAPFAMATVEFLAIGNGLSNLILTDPMDGNLNWDDNVASGVTPNFINGTAAVGVVPLPAAAWLMLSGLGACGFLGRRKTTTVAA